MEIMGAPTESNDGEIKRGAKCLVVETLWSPPPQTQTTQERGDAMGQKTKKGEGVVDWKGNQAADSPRVEEVEGVHKAPGL